MQIAAAIKKSLAHVDEGAYRTSTIRWPYLAHLFGCSLENTRIACFGTITRLISPGDQT